MLSTGDGRVIVIDVGPDPTSMDRCLNMLDVNDIALLMISHFHADHIGGLEAVLSGRSVAAVGVGSMLLPESGFRTVKDAAESHAVPVVSLRAGMELTLGSVNVGGSRTVASGSPPRYGGTARTPRTISRWW